MKIKRKIEWISALDLRNRSKLECLQKKMTDFYSNNPNYYTDISFTEILWLDKAALVQQDIISECQHKTAILEIGCGEAFILKSNKINKRNYTGLDFSEQLILKNKISYPESNFIKIENPYELPLENESFDIVFSHFVIEHTVYPNLFLNECKRVLKKNGLLIIAAPNFLGRKGITSQKSGFSKGTGREKLNDGKYLDMIFTAYDNKIRIPAATFYHRLLASKKPRFFININPTCFIYDFSPDVDAVYLTYEKEIKNYLRNEFNWTELNDELNRFVSINNLIYIKGVKKV